MRKFLLLPVIVLVLVGSGLAAAERTPTPPPTPVPPYGSPSPFPTTLHTPSPAFRHPPDIEAASAILEDLDTGQILYTLHADDRRAIASTTKIMTALVVLERAEPSDVVTVSEAAAEEGGAGAGFSELGLRDGERLTVRQLLYALMLQSANDAAVALADQLSGTTEKFVKLMNREAHRIGLTRTKFYSPNGLDDRGYSTARSLAAVTRRAERDEVFASVARTRFHVVPGDPPRHIQNRNVLLWLYPGAIGVKTGFTTRAGYCLVAAATRQGRRVVAVVLGEPSGDDSFSDAASLLDYGFHAFVQREVVEDGQPFRSLRIDGLPYPVEAERALSASVRASAGAEPVVETRLVTIQPPLEVGERVGTVVATLDGRALGRVPLVVSAVPPGSPGSLQVPSPEVPWWSRSIDAIDRVASGLFHAVFG